MRFYIVDAFAEHPFGGNTAGVVMLDDGSTLGEEQMQQVAAELRYSETAFVRQLSEHHYQLRYFTPAGEVPLCGHATLATFAVMHQEGIATGRCTAATAAGEVVVDVGQEVMMLMPASRLVATLGEADSAEAYRAIGADIWADATQPQVVETGIADIMLQLPDRQSLNSLCPDMDAIVRLTRRLGAASLHVFALGEAECTAYVRDFAPLYAIPEEAATGTANASLAHYLHNNGLCNESRMSFVQGETMGRPSRITTLTAADGRISVGGRAAVVAQGELFLPRSIQ